jgi:F-type H+-transporting ATPase subunit gamma
VPTRVRHIPPLWVRNLRRPLELYNQAGVESAPDAKILYVAITSDRGLCGGIHSSVSKAAKKALLNHPEARVVVCGDKPKAQLSRMMPQQMALSFNQIGKDIPTFAEAAAIADEITTHGGEWDELKIIYNKYISAISYEATTVTVAGPKALAEAAGFKAYEMEEDVSKDLTEFALANIIFQALVEGHAAEQSARRTAMENASNVGRGLARDDVKMLTVNLERQRYDRLVAVAVQPWSTGCYYVRLMCFV